MRKGLFVATGLVLLAGCEVQGPDFLTGEGGLLGPATIVQGETVPVTSIRTATIERSFRGVIVRVEAVAPTQGRSGRTGADAPARDRPLRSQRSAAQPARLPGRDRPGCGHSAAASGVISGMIRTALPAADRAISPRFSRCASRPNTS